MTTDLERVTARAVECGADDSCGTFHFWPQELLAFEQATIKANFRMSEEEGRYKDEMNLLRVEVILCEEQIERLQVADSLHRAELVLNKYIEVKNDYFKKNK